jgi:chemotaxis protein CheC
MNLKRFAEISAPASAAASRALARLAGPGAAVKLLNAELISPAECRFLDREETSAGVSMSIKGGLEGEALLCFPEAKALALGEILAGRMSDGTARPADLDESALKELGNIICGNYVTALSNQLRVKVMPGIPYLMRGACGLMLEQVVARLGLDAAAALLVDVELDLPAGSVLGRLLLCFKTERAINA